MKFGSIRIKLRKGVNRQRKIATKTWLKKQKGVQDVWFTDSIECDIFVELKVIDRQEAEELNRTLNEDMDIDRTELRVSI